jgi:diaminopimelate epimerase
MPIPFTKMHGAGNDYIYVDAFKIALPADVEALVPAMCERHTGVGADGLIEIGPSEIAAARMRMWNADGSRGEMCGNGLRCVAKYLFDRGMAPGDEFSIETDAGVKPVWVEAADGIATRVKVSMGEPVFDPAEIPTTLAGTPPLNVPLIVDGWQLWVTSLSMGNPHCIIFVDEPTDEWILELGPKIERHPKFPNRVNVSFAQVVSRGEIRMRVWERGSGETRACGTGASAAVVAGVLSDQLGRHVACRLPGGVLDVEWNTDNRVYLTGPAVEVFQGTWRT